MSSPPPQDPSLLLVTFQPSPTLPLAQFHDWYNNEHAPARLRLPSFKNGFRYRARINNNRTNKPINDAEPDAAAAARDHQQQPGWMVTYHVSAISALTSPPYTTLREPGVKTDRETEVMKSVDIRRRICRHFHGSDEQQSRSTSIGANESGAVLVLVSVDVRPKQDGAFEEWCEEEHVPRVKEVKGWLRSRRYVNTLPPAPAPAPAPISGSGPAEAQGATEYLVLHEFDATNGVEEPDFLASLHVPPSLGSQRALWLWDLVCVYGPAPRDLGALHDPAAHPFQSRDGRTLTWPVSVPNGKSSSADKISRCGDIGWPYDQQQQQPDWPAIRSYVTMADGLDIPYQLEGSGDPDAPLLVLVNRIGTTYRVWDAFVVAFLAAAANKTRYRVLRYDARGSHPVDSDADGQRATLDLLAHDLVALLDALRVPSAVAAVGVGLGGATALNASLNFPGRIPAFVACNTGAAMSQDRSGVWTERMAVADKEDAKNASGEKIVGDQLADALVKRWFSEQSWKDPRLAEEIAGVKEMVKTRPREGFGQIVQTLCEFDVRPPLAAATAKGLFVASGEDGVLLEAMKDLGRGYANGSSLSTLGGAGHLLMVEEPERMAKVVVDFVNSL